jgi:serine/threonine protein kinase
MLSALAYLDDKAICHGDVKPENILCNDIHNFYLADFGNAHYQGTTEKLGATYTFLAPEFWTGRSDTRSDVWSLGITGLDMLKLLPQEDKAQRDPKVWFRQIIHRSKRAPQEIQEMLEPNLELRKRASEIVRASPASGSALIETEALRSRPRLPTQDNV